jgi:hypothetical protein
MRNNAENRFAANSGSNSLAAHRPRFLAWLPLAAILALWAVDLRGRLASAATVCAQGTACRNGYYDCKEQDKCYTGFHLRFPPGVHMLYEWLKL